MINLGLKFVNFFHSTHDLLNQLGFISCVWWEYSLMELKASFELRVFIFLYPSLYNPVSPANEFNWNSISVLWFINPSRCRLPSLFRTKLLIINKHYKYFRNIIFVYVLIISKIDRLLKIIISRRYDDSVKFLIIFIEISQGDSFF